MVLYVIGILQIRPAIGLLREITQHIDRIRRIIQPVIFPCGSSVINRGTVQIQQFGPLAHDGMLMDDFRHVVCRRDYFLHLLHVAVLARDVCGSQHLYAVHPRLCRRQGFAIRQLGQVAIRDVVGLHEPRQQVYHGRTAVVPHQENPVFTSAHLIPIFGLGHVLRHDPCHGIVDAQRYLAAHAHPLLRRIARDVRQQLYQVSIVHHGTVEQHLFLGHGQLPIVLHVPTVLFEKSFKSRIVSSKQSLASCLVQNACHVQIVDETKRVFIVTLFLQPAINGIIQPRGLPDQVFVLTRLHSKRRQQGSRRKGLYFKSMTKTIFHFCFYWLNSISKRKGRLK